MTTINIVTAICFAILTAEVLYVLISLIVKSREDRIKFLRSFKMGKCAIIYFSAIPLIFIGHLYAGEGVFAGFFNSINQILNFVFLKYTTTTIQVLMNVNMFYTVTVYYCYILVGLNALVFTFSLVGQRLWEYAQSIKAKSPKKDKLFIFGYNKNSVQIYNSEKEKDKVIFDKVSSQDKYAMYTKKISFVSISNFENAVSLIFNTVLKGNRQYTVVVNTENDDNNLAICQKFLSCIENVDSAVREKIFESLGIYVFGDPKFEAIYDDAVSKCFGCLHYINKYQMIAMDFIDKYPFTKFLTEKHIDYSKALIKKDVDINVCMIGFGKTNRQIFLTSVANNQFVYQSKSGIELKKVKYHIFDKDTANNKNLNHSYYRYLNECADVDPKNYLPLPAIPSEETYYQLDINDPKFYQNIKKISAKSPNDVNFIIIAFGSDLENLDMAQKLAEKKLEWNIENLVIFVKVRNYLKNQTLLEDDDCYFIGNEKDIYSIDAITGDNIFKLAKMRDEIYELEYKITHEKGKVDSETLEEIKKASNKNWYQGKSQLERESSLYCCLSLKSKLNLIGLDYCPKSFNDLPGLTEQEYLDIYADKVDTDTLNLNVFGKKVVNYTLDYVPSKRTNLAIQEHQRWNSFMISKGMIPSTKDEILNEKIVKDGKLQYSNGRNYSLRRHGNLTSFQGLIEFRKMIAKRDGTGQENTDVIKYDYQLMDDAFFLLDSCGFKIVKK